MNEFILSNQYRISVEYYWQEMAKANAEYNMRKYFSLKDKLYKYKQEKMMEFYDSIVADTREKEIAKKVIYRAIEFSITGQVIVHIPKDLDKDKVDEVVWNIIGDLVLDYYITKDEDGWYIDTMFAGMYIPGWNGDGEVYEEEWEDAYDN